VLAGAVAPPRRLTRSNVENGAVTGENTRRSSARPSIRAGLVKRAFIERSVHDVTLVYAAPVSDTMSWFWIGLAIVLPFAVGLAIAWPFWRKPSRDPVGTVLGAFVVVASGVALVGREFIHVQRLTNHCLAAETVWRFFPEPFTRFFIYIAIAMAQVFVLFMIGWGIENRIRSRAFAAEWRQR